MSIERRCLGLGTIVGIALLALGSSQNAFAVDYTVSNLATCTALPGGGETWDGLTSTCSKTTNLNIGIGDTLTVPNGITLSFPSNDNIRNDGIITNNGIINLTRGDIINRNSASFSNSKIIILNSTLGNTGHLTNQDDAIFTNTVTGSIIIDGLDGPNNNRAQLRNQDDADFTNFGTIIIDGTTNNAGQLRNRNDAVFTNSGTITISGASNNSGQLRNQNNAEFTNSGPITIGGTNDNSGQLRNLNNAEFTNSGPITIGGINDNSGRLTNNGLIINNCGEIIFVSMNGNPIQEGHCETLSSGSGYAYEDPTIGKSHDGRQVVEDGICIDEQCWTVTADYHQDFELVEMLSDSTHTITTTVFCQSGVYRCNYVAFGVSPYGTNINDSVWNIILQKDHLDNWSMKIIDPDGYLGDVTSTTQLVNDNKHLAASATIEFKKPTPGMILNVEVRDSNGGYRDFKFNDGISIADTYAYPSVESSYETPLNIKPLCHNENPNKRYTCAFDKVKEWTIKNAERKLSELG